MIFGKSGGNKCRMQCVKVKNEKLLSCKSLLDFKYYKLSQYFIFTFGVSGEGRMG